MCLYWFVSFVKVNIVFPPFFFKAKKISTWKYGSDWIVGPKHRCQNVSWIFRFIYLQFVVISICHSAHQENTRFCVHFIWHFAMLVVNLLFCSVSFQLIHFIILSEIIPVGNPPINGHILHIFYFVILLFCHFVTLIACHI